MNAILVQYHASMQPKTNNLSALGYSYSNHTEFNQGITFVKKIVFYMKHFHQIYILLIKIDSTFPVTSLKFEDII